MLQGGGRGAGTGEGNSPQTQEDSGSQELAICKGHAGRESSGIFRQKAKELFLGKHTF